MPHDPLKAARLALLRVGARSTAATTRRQKNPEEAAAMRALLSKALARDLQKRTADDAPVALWCARKGERLRLFGVLDEKNSLRTLWATAVLPHGTLPPYEAVLVFSGPAHRICELVKDKPKGP